MVGKGDQDRMLELVSSSGVAMGLGEEKRRFCFYFDERVKRVG